MAISFVATIATVETAVAASILIDALAVEAQKLGGKVASYMIMRWGGKRKKEKRGKEQMRKKKCEINPWQFEKISFSIR